MPDTLGNGFYFGSVDTANVYAGKYLAAEGGNVRPVYLSLQNPLTLTAHFDGRREVDREKRVREALGLPAATTAQHVTQAAKAAGYDGVTYQLRDDIEYVAFDPQQIRSAISKLAEAAMPRVVRTIPSAEARDMLHAAYYGGKNKDLKPTPFHKDEQQDFVLVDLPLSMIQPNEEGDRYDATSNMDRVQAYAKAQITTPVFITYSAYGARRQQAEGFKGGWVADGGHRVSAARLRGDSHIAALMRKSDFDRLVTATQHK